MTVLPTHVVPMGAPFALESDDRNLDRNLGAAYNASMELLREDQWAIFLDHDAGWTTREWYRQIVEAVEFAPNAGAFTAVSHRIACDWQKCGDPECYDMRRLREFGEQQRQVRTLLDITATMGLGGVVIVISKRAWKDACGFVDGLLCVDHQMHFALRRISRPIYVIEGLFVYHWRRGNGDGLPRDTPRAANCPCRGPEPKPINRLTLPGRAWTPISRD